MRTKTNTTGTRKETVSITHARWEDGAEITRKYENDIHADANRSSRPSAAAAAGSPAIQMTRFIETSKRGRVSMMADGVMTCERLTLRDLPKESR